MGVVTKGKRDNTQVRLRWPDGSHSRWHLIHKLEEPPTPLTHLAEAMAAAEAARAAEEEAREKGSQGTAGAGAGAGVRAGQEPEPEPEPQAGAAGAAGARAGGLLGADITAPEDATTDNSVWLPDHILAYALFLVRVRHRKAYLPELAKFAKAAFRLLADRNCRAPPVRSRGEWCR